MIAIFATGLFSRSHFTSALPHLLTKAAGDALWTAMIFTTLGLLWPRAQTRTLAAAAFAISVAVEFSQLDQAGWINNIRGTYLGGVILGYGFHATDFIWYALGIAIGFCADLFTLVRGGQKPAPEIGKTRDPA